MSYQKSNIRRSSRSSEHRHRFSRFSRFSRFTVKGDNVSNIRKSLADYVRDELEEMDRPLFYQRVFVLAKNKTTNFTPPKPTLLKYLPDLSKMDFKIVLQQEIYHILSVCEDMYFTTDHFTGAFICMDDYTLILAESTEDMVGRFCLELSKIADNYFTANRVFAVEDKTGVTFFEGFVCRRARAIHTTEQFAPATADDEELMCEQHNIILNKLRKVYECMNHKITMDGTMKSLHDLMRNPQNLPDLMLASNQYSKLLPEVERIELVLNSKRFYRSLKDFVPVYTSIPEQQNEESHTWPIPHSYLPSGVFQQQQYYVNLTFADYGKKETPIELLTGTSESNETERQSNAE